MLQKARITAFAVSQLLRKTQQEGGGGRGATYELKARPPPLTLRLGLKRESNTGAFL